MKKETIHQLLNMVIAVLLISVFVVIYKVNFDISMDAIDYQWSATTFIHETRLFNTYIYLSPFLVWLIFSIKQKINE